MSISVTCTVTIAIMLTAMSAATQWTCDDSLPTPSTTKKIKPVMKVFETGKKSVITIKYDEKASDFVDKLHGQGFLMTSDVVFIVHGFQNKLTTDWLVEMKDTILRKETKTVILVGWAGGANLPIWEYAKAAANTQRVGQWLAPFVKELNKHRFNIWGIGYSLGAHLLGKAGRDSGAFDRITGLDPAGPCFENDNQDKRLKSSDATFVDVIHTDGVKYLFNIVGIEMTKIPHYGTLIPLGTIDFYPNYGHSQPGCDRVLLGSHKRAVELFTWSINHPGKFKTGRVLQKAPTFEQPVDSYETGQSVAEMGYYADKFHLEGNYILWTEKKQPWAEHSDLSQL